MSKPKENTEIALPTHSKSNKKYVDLQSNFHDTVILFFETVYFQQIQQHIFIIIFFICKAVNTFILHNLFKYKVQRAFE